MGDHETAVQAAVAREKRRQAVRKIRVDEALDSSLRDARQLGDRHRKRIERERERLAVEVPVRDERAVVDEHERVVRCSVQLDGDRVVGVVEEIPRSAVHLWGAAKRVRILNLVAPAVRLDDRGALEQPQHVRRRIGLPAQRPQRMDLRQERVARSLERLERQRAREIRGSRQPARPHEPERKERGHELGPVDQRQPFLRLEPGRLEPDARKRLEPGQPLAVEERLPLADER